MKCTGGVSDQSSNSSLVCYIHFHMNALEKGMNLSFLPFSLAMSYTAGRLGSLALDGNQYKRRKTIPNYRENSEKPLHYLFQECMAIYR